MKIDSELVPRGKGEKQSGEDSEIDLKPYAYKESEPCTILGGTMHYVVPKVVHGHGVPIEE